MATLNVPDDHLKALREVLCLAQNDALHSGRTAVVFDVERIQSLINQIDQHRPLGVNGKHGDRHTDTCGCDDNKPVRSTGRPHVVVTRALGKHSITLDGERLRGVRSVEVVNDVRDLPIVRIDILPASVRVDLTSTVPSAPES